MQQNGCHLIILLLFAHGHPMFLSSLICKIRIDKQTFNRLYANDDDSRHKSTELYLPVKASKKILAQTTRQQETHRPLYLLLQLFGHHCHYQLLVVSSLPKLSLLPYGPLSWQHEHRRNPVQS
jgi:hypothetical protein